MDLAQFDLAADAERGTTVQLLNPRTGELLKTDDGSPVEIDVQGADGLAYRRAQRDMQNEMSRRPQARGAITLEEIDNAASRVLAAVTTGWRGIVVDGQAWDCNPDAATALYQRFDWIRTQVDAAVSDRIRYQSAQQA